MLEEKTLQMINDTLRDLTRKIQDESGCIMVISWAVTDEEEEKYGGGFVGSSDEINICTISKLALRINTNITYAL